MVNLKTELFSDFILRTPIGISSSHFTGNEKALAFIVKQKPTYLTIKSTSQLLGGQGKGKREFRNLERIGIPCAVYSYGPYELELLDLSRTLELVRFVRSLDQTIILGSSILHIENFETLLPAIEDMGVDYFEINFKYFARLQNNSYFDEPHSAIDDSVDKFGKVIQQVITHTNLPVLIKLPRDAPWLFTKNFLEKLNNMASGQKIGLIIANSHRFFIPPNPDRVTQNIYSVDSKQMFGALSGTILLPETLTLIRQIAMHCNLPIIASGGITNGYHVLVAAFLGASAVQVCTALNLRRGNAYNDIHDELIEYLDKFHIPSFQEIIGKWK